jgi:hypothetical protein
MSKGMHWCVQDNADAVFGAITVGTGVLGTLCGGIALDKLVGASIPGALKVSFSYKLKNPICFDFRSD